MCYEIFRHIILIGNQPTKKKHQRHNYNELHVLQKGMKTGNVLKRQQPYQRIETAQGQQWVFNVERKFFIRRRASGGPKQLRPG